MTAVAKTTEHLPAKVSTKHTASAGQYLTFILGGESYAIGILHTKEIIDYGYLTEVPMMPSFVRGVINLRGSAVPVIDLQARFGKGNTLIDKRTSIIIVETLRDTEEGEPQDIGIIVDAVNEVVEINQNDIEPAPSFGASVPSNFINAMAKRDDSFVILLNVNRVLSIEEMAAVSRGVENA
ncbi:chemotaxis protein CheW [Methylomonas sp. AM2-LC]|uniref:chemotaxis protein CheW n=1 Tax=Methylomonas sp. AM2-LC TaxID=3153301 RepID=UPI003262D2AE